MNDVLLAKVGAWVLGLLPAALGSALSLYYKKKEDPPLSRTGAFIIFFLGIGIGHLLGNGTIELANIDQKSFVATCIIMTWGLFGLALIQELYNLLPKITKAVFEQIPEIFRAAWQKFLGDK